MSWIDQAQKATFEPRPFIGGDYCQSSSGDVFRTINPATRSELAEFSDGSAGDIDKAVIAARQAFRNGWRTLAPTQRKLMLLVFADNLRAAKDQLALLDCLEMGMPITSALDQVELAVDFLQHNAELADKLYGEVVPADSAHILAMTIPEPRGVVGVISPWNYPLLTAILGIAPALATGNTVVVKPSEQTPSSTLKLAEIACQSGLPAGVFNVVLGSGITAGAALASHSDVDKLHFTGSTAVGRQLMVYAGQSNGKPVMLEMGGKSPQIVFEDAVDLTGLGTSLVQSAFWNTGQLCVARTRLIVHENSKEQVLDAIKRATKNAFTIGNPLDENVNFGPIASAKQYQRVRDYIDLAQQEGYSLTPLNTAGLEPSDGYYQQPVLFDNADNGMRIAQEEIFGPAMAVITFKTDEEAIQIANDVNYGLAATAWTKDLGRARRLARDIESGRVDIRTCDVAEAPDTVVAAEPFGASGHGVLGGMQGLNAFVRQKAVQIITD